MLDGIDIRHLSLRALRHNVTLLQQEHLLRPGTVTENIGYGKPGASHGEIVAAAKAAGAHEFTSALPAGYDSRVGQHGRLLSGGQRQRIAIARTLLLNPPILILDDATSAVDVQVEQGIHEALKTLMQGRTTLIVAHRLSTIGLADRVVLLDGGRIVADGTHTELLDSTPLYVEVLAQAEEAERQARDEQAALDAEEQGGRR